MPQIPLTKAVHIVPYSIHLKTKGVNVEKYFEQAKLPPSAVENPTGFLPSASIWQLFEMMTKLTGSSELIIDATTDIQINSTSPTGKWIVREPTLFRAINTFINLSRTQSSTVSHSLKEINEENYSFQAVYHLDPSKHGWTSVLYNLVFMLKTVRLANAQWSPKQLWVNVPFNQERLQILQKLGADHVLFSQKSCGFSIPTTMMSLPIQEHAEEPIKNETHIYQLNEFAPVPSVNFPESLKQLIHSYRQDGWLKIEETAEILGVSKRTLQRRLSTEKLDYFSVIDRVRFDLATEKLVNSDQKLHDIAMELGYQSPANFTRAFKRWTGLSPNHYRKQNQKIEAA